MSKYLPLIYSEKKRVKDFNYRYTFAQNQNEYVKNLTRKQI